LMKILLLRQWRLNMCGYIKSNLKFGQGKVVEPVAIENRLRQTANDPIY
jgi:hypothetical protein